MKRHRHKWEFSCGLVRLPRRARCTRNVCPRSCPTWKIAKYGYECAKHKCKRKIEPEWWEFDQAMWYVSVRIAYLTGDWDAEGMKFFNLWSLSLMQAGMGK